MTIFSSLVEKCGSSGCGCIEGTLPQPGGLDCYYQDVGAKFSVSGVPCPIMPRPDADPETCGTCPQGGCSCNADTSGLASGWMDCTYMDTSAKYSVPNVPCPLVPRTDIEPGTCGTPSSSSSGYTPLMSRQPNPIFKAY